MPLLHAAAHLNHSELFSCLVTMPINPNIKPALPTMKNISILHMLVMHNNAKLLRQLLENRGKFATKLVDSEDSNGRNAYDLAMNLEHHKAMEVLNEFAFTPSISPSVHRFVNPI